MEYIIITVIIAVITVVMKFIFGCSIKEIKEKSKSEELDEITKKYPTNLEICNDYLKKLNNSGIEVKQEESEASYYMVMQNKIIIGNISKSYTRIQTIAHECIHTIQNKKILKANVIVSNIYIIYFLIIFVLEILNELPYKNIFFVALILIGFVYYSIKTYLENDAMIKAKYLAKEYMEEIKLSGENEINKIVSKYEEINNMGIKATNYMIFLNIMITIILFLIVCIF